MKNKTFSLVTALAAVALIVVGALTVSVVPPREVSAQSTGQTRDSYYRLRGDAPTLNLDGITATSGLTVSSSAITGSGLVALATDNNPKVAVAVSTSAAGATVPIYVALYHKDGSGTYSLLGISDIQTATGSASYVDSAGRYLEEDILTFDTFAANTVVVRTGAISAGNIDLTAWVYGSKSGQPSP